MTNHWPYSDISECSHICLTSPSWKTNVGDAHRVHVAGVWIANWHSITSLLLLSSLNMISEWRESTRCNMISKRLHSTTSCLYLPRDSKYLVRVSNYLLRVKLQQQQHRYHSQLVKDSNSSRCSSSSIPTAAADAVVVKHCGLRPQ